MPQDLEQADLTGGSPEFSASNPLTTQRDGGYRRYVRATRTCSCRMWSVAVIILIVGAALTAGILIHNSRRVEVRRNDSKPSISANSTSARVAALATSAAPVTAINPGDGGPLLCSDDQLPAAGSTTQSTADSTKDGKAASYIEANTPDAPETRRPKRVNLRLKMDADPVVKLAAALEEVSEAVQGVVERVIGKQDAGNGTTGGGNSTKLVASVAKIKKFLADKAENGWMPSKACKGWFSHIPGMEESLGELQKVYYGPHSRVLILDFNTPEAASKAATALQGLSKWVEVSVLDVQMKRLDAALALTGPNDPLYSQQWGLQSVGVTDNAQTRTAGAWAASTGDKAVVVAIVDTGVDYTHPDLASNMWINKGEIPGNGIDDDGNGYVDDYYGYNFVEGVLNSSDPMDDHFHGTHVAGIVGAVGNNDRGVSGVVTNVSIMALKVLSSNGIGSTSWHIQGVEYALANGAHILSASLGGYENDPSLSAALTVASDNGMMLVAAAGNERTNTDRNPHFPSGGDQASLISVAASTPSGCMAGFSNYGSQSVDIVAPGSYILSTVPRTYRIDGYAVVSGTSQATPFVTGAAALVLSYMKQNGKPWEGQGVEVKNLLLATARTNQLYTGFVATDGSLDVGAAMAVAANTTFTPRPPPPPPSKPKSPSFFGSSATVPSLGMWMHLLCLLVSAALFV